MRAVAALRVACWAEAVKLRRSMLPVLTAGGSCLAPVMGGVFMLALGAGSASQLVEGKAQLLGGTPDVAGYFELLLAIYAAGGLVLCGIVTAWVFGREFSDRTAVDLLALPTPRAAVVAAKFVVVVGWCAVLTAIVFAVGLVVVAVLGVPGWSLAAVAAAGARLAALYGLSIVLMTPVGFVASAGRGYLPAIGLVMLVVVVAQPMATVGVGAWFPWAVPALAVGVASVPVGPVAYVLVAATAVTGAVLTVTWWRFADHR